MSLTAFRTAAEVFDQGLDYVKANVTNQVACSQMPTTYAEANATYKVAEVTVANTDFTIANGDELGSQPRKITVAQKEGTGTAVGEVAAVAWLDVTNTRLVHAKPASLAGGETEVGDGNPVTFPAHKLELLSGVPAA